MVDDASPVRWCRVCATGSAESHCWHCGAEYTSATKPVRLDGVTVPPPRQVAPRRPWWQR